MRIKFLASGRNMGCVGHRREPSKQKGNLNFLRVSTIDEEREPLSIVDWAKSFSALNLIASVRPSETEFVRIGSGSECLIKSAGGFDFMNRYSMRRIRKIDVNRNKNFPVLSLYGTAYFATKRAGIRHDKVNPKSFLNNGRRIECGFEAIENLTNFHGLLLLVNEIDLTPLFSHH